MGVQYTLYSLLIYVKKKKQRKCDYNCCFAPSHRQTICEQHQLHKINWNWQSRFRMTGTEKKLGRDWTKMHLAEPERYLNTIDRFEYWYKRKHSKAKHFLLIQNGNFEHKANDAKWNKCQCFQYYFCFLCTNDDEYEKSSIKTEKRNKNVFDRGKMKEKYWFVQYIHFKEINWKSGKWRLRFDKKKH